jgi:hypothetical protein
LVVDIHAEDVVEQNTSPFGGSQAPTSARSSIENLLVLLRAVLLVLLPVPVEEVLVGPQEKGARPARWVQNLELGGFLDASALQ